MVETLKDRTIFISGGSRGIGLAIAKRAARDGANVTIAAKTAEPHPKLPGTIYTAAKEIEAAGGQALPVICDIREDDQVEAAVAKTIERFGGIDICINNASAVMPTPMLHTPMKCYDLMNDVNTRGTFLVSKMCAPYLKKGTNPHILSLAPPLDMDPKWFGPHVAYTIAKMGMSMVMLGLARELQPAGIAANSLWPLTAIDTAAVRNVLGGDSVASRSRTPEIVADAAYEILTQDPVECTGNFFIDEEVLREAGVNDFEKYKADPSADGPLMRDFFVPDAAAKRLPTETVSIYQ